jgi:hypothetical protein
MIEWYRNWKYKIITQGDEIKHYLDNVTIMEIKLNHMIGDSGVFRIKTEPYYNFYNKSKLFPTTYMMTVDGAKRMINRCSTRQAKYELTRFILSQT